MTYVSFDPRVAFREGLGTAKYDEDGNPYYCIIITDNENQSIKIPIYLAEEVKSDEFPNLPFMEMYIPPGATTYEPHDIGAATRKIKTRIMINIHFTNVDNIDKIQFAKKIKDELQDLMRSNQSTTTGITFMNIEDDGMEPEPDGRQVAYCYRATLYCLYHDLC